ncbi:MAG: alternate F1F0 ATPase, F1 subunit alpha [Desulfovibrionaceae bacterium]|nr:alternate F1F0 ATPase, F1 subunit alpha [Desulfovibrionaceae bacterium]
MESGAGSYAPGPESGEVGRVVSVGRGVVWVEGLGRVKAEELVVLSGGRAGMALDILPDRVGVVTLSETSGFSAGDEVARTGRVLDVPVGEALVGRVLDPLGRPLDGLGPPAAAERWPVQREAPPILHRAPVQVPLETGFKVVDALIPIGRGQRELILGDRQTGKTALAVDAILNQKGKDVLCVYCAIGQRSSSAAKVVETLRSRGAMDYSLVVVVEGDDAPGLQYAAPYAAASMAEWFMHRGRDVLVVFDDLTRHARAYRELSLLMRRPPGREAFPGDIFFIHSRLLERSTRLRPEHGGGSITALPIVETEAQNISAYIPTNLISITDGQIYLSPDLFGKGVLPAVDVSRSVSRVGGKAQSPAYRLVAGDLKLSYSQFQELEVFARFGTRLDEVTRRSLEHGRRVREVLKQDQFSPLSAAEQVAALWAVARGLFDDLALDRVPEAEGALAALVREDPVFCADLVRAGRGDEIWERLAVEVKRVLGREAGDAGA